MNPNDETLVDNCPSRINVHGENADLADQIAQLAKQVGLQVRRNCQSLGHHDGHYQYVIMRFWSRDCADYGSRVVKQWSARFFRNYMPSVDGERHCLYAMRDHLMEACGFVRTQAQGRTS